LDGRGLVGERSIFPTSAHATGVWLIVAAAVAGLCLLYLWQSAQILDLTARREGLRKELSSTEEVNRWLDFQIGEAFSLDRISEVARARLGMVEPGSVRYVTVPASTP